MFNKEYFYFNTIRKYVIAFGSMFKNMKIKRYDKNGNPQKEIKIPLVYASGETFIQRLKSSQNSVEVDISKYLPIISFQLTGLEIDISRQKQILMKKYLKNKDTNEIFIFKNPLPVNYSFEVSLWTKKIDDMLQIIEQIIPVFQPNISIPIIEFPEFDIVNDIIITLNSTTFDFQIEHGEEENQIIKSNLEFVMKGYLYPPIKSGRLIKHININFHEKETYREFLELLKLDIIPENANKDDDYEVKKEIIF